MPERVVIFSVTKLRPGQVTMTSAAMISRSRVEPCVWVSGVPMVFCIFNVPVRWGTTAPGSTPATALAALRPPAAAGH